MFTKALLANNPYANINLRKKTVHRSFYDLRTNSNTIIKTFFTNNKEVQ
jgi:hypothetical protein